VRKGITRVALWPDSPAGAVNFSFSRLVLCTFCIPLFLLSLSFLLMFFLFSFMMLLFTGGSENDFYSGVPGVKKNGVFFSFFWFGLIRWVFLTTGFELAA
jgi:hypothetical protein